MIRRLPALLLLTASACGPQPLRVVMNAENNSGQSGFAVLTALSSSKTRVEIDVAASNDPRPQPAHVHEGRCGEIGGIKAGLANLAPDAKKPGRFTSTTEIDVGLDTLEKGTFAINAHDVRDFSLYITCGQVH
ncbi:MAG: CHRD domain-containing protein [Archangiaceae bacterium]|nr:CHRD domain-containing protein [Archangiaceae bacterium]